MSSNTTTGVPRCPDPGRGTAVASQGAAGGHLGNLVNARGGADSPGGRICVADQSARIRQAYQILGPEPDPDERGEAFERDEAVSECGQDAREAPERLLLR